MSIKFEKDKFGKNVLCFDKDYAVFLDRLCPLFNFQYDCKCFVNEYIDYLEKVSDRFNISHNFILEKCNFFINDFDKLMSEFTSFGFDMEGILNQRSSDNSLYWSFKKEYISSFLISCDDSQIFENLTSLFFKLLNFQKKVYKSVELISFKDSLFNDLKDVASLNTVKSYQAKYDALLEKKPFDIAATENLYREIQSIILDDFKHNVTAISDYKPGNKFRLLCHSTNSVDWEKNYLDNYLSASLLTEEHTDTYRSPFGLIVNPNYIVSMDCEDLYTKNSADDESELSLYSVLPRILSMNHLISGTKLYNEVVVKNPDSDDLFLGVFCITDGSKELNPIYLRAETLHKDFPDLPFIDIDITLYLPPEDLIYNRNDLIDSIREELNITTPVFDGYYDMYEPFWEKFVELKRSSNYGLLDILSLFSYYYNIFEDGLTPKRNMKI